MRMHKCWMVLAVVTMSQCTPAGAVAPLTSGSYTLVEYNGKRVPVDFGVLPPKGPAPTTCHFALTNGALKLDLDSRVFDYFYEYHNACDGHLLAHESLSGTFTPDGDLLVLTVTGAEGPVHFSARVTARQILVTLPGEALGFAR